MCGWGKPLESNKSAGVVERSGSRSLSVPFVQLTKLMIICGRISNVLNGRRGRARTLVSSAEPLVEQLAELQLRLVQFVSTLPETLR